MSPFDDQTSRSLSFEENRLETPSTVGYRRGMSSSGVIGRKLGAVYSVDRDMPEEIDSCIQQLHTCRLGRTG